MNNELEIIVNSIGKSITEKPYCFQSKTNKWYSIKVGNKTLVKVDIRKSVTIIDGVNNNKLTFNTDTILKSRQYK